MAAQRDVVVVGGGVMGCAVAWRAAQAGCRVTLLERGRLGEGATRAAGGILGVQAEGPLGPLQQLSLASRGQYAAFVAQAQQHSGLQVPYVERGSLALGLDEEDTQRRRAQVQADVDQGRPARWLAQQEASELWRGLAVPPQGAAHFPMDGVVDPQALCRALAQAARASGATLQEDTPVTGVRTVGGVVRGVTTTHGQHHADVVVWCAGAWSSQLQDLGVRPTAVRPVRGQMLALRHPTVDPPGVVFRGHGYLVPRANGVLLVGSTMEERGFETAVTVEGLARLTGLALGFYPQLKDAVVVDTWSGLRPATPDGLPILGEGLVSGLLWATGHFRNGILLAPVTSQLVAQLLTGEQPAVDLAPFSPKRPGIAA